ncbi:fluoride efflux transporter CrcB [Pseudalkalibacillus hwajinpoensis]|uniref:Fluoride-specific ion channel FluC n=1 Tax=Guptibacillus hwajinpoensis TaxID=208199 RepID=A0A4U1MBM9_9BACL|nr:fluoride efflux transporter CrcB [Pseudalkalibacillus hwajinpoensis]TKD67931.1 fluoride efflux transporter CrcB [Pseudalkalibacillus hwajinpoensis]
MKNSLAIVSGGALGATLRAMIGTVMNGVPLSTFLVNVTGSILLGFFYQFVQSDKRLSDPLKKFIATGVLGSFTTFSTYSLDLFVYLREGQFFVALLYGIGSILIGIVGVLLGITIARKIRRIPTWNG